jgi:hypothetical protein
MKEKFNSLSDPIPPWAERMKKTIVDTLIYASIASRYNSY